MHIENKTIDDVNRIVKLLSQFPSNDLAAICAELRQMGFADSPESAGGIPRSLRGQFCQGDSEVTNIHHAVVNGELELLTSILEAEPALLPYRTPDGESLLQAAYRNRHFRIANYLLRHGAPLEPLEATIKSAVQAAAFSIRISGQPGGKQQADQGFLALQLLLKKCGSSIYGNGAADVLESIKLLRLRENPSRKTVLDVNRIIGVLCQYQSAGLLPFCQEFDRLGFGDALIPYIFSQGERA